MSYTEEVRRHSAFIQSRMLRIMFGCQKRLRKAHVSSDAIADALVNASRAFVKEALSQYMIAKFGDTLGGEAHIAVARSVDDVMSYLHVELIKQIHDMPRRRGLAIVKRD